MEIFFSHREKLFHVHNAHKFLQIREFQSEKNIFSINSRGWKNFSHNGMKQRFVLYCAHFQSTNHHHVIELANNCKFADYLQIDITFVSSFVAHDLWMFCANIHVSSHYKIVRYTAKKKIIWYSIVWHGK